MMIHSMYGNSNSGIREIFSCGTRKFRAMESGIQLQWNPRSTEWDLESSTLNLEFTGVEPRI